MSREHDPSVASEIVSPIVAIPILDPTARLEKLRPQGGCGGLQKLDSAMT